MATRATSVIVHFGETAPTVRVANALAGFDTEVVIVANDGAPRPAGLDPSVDWRVPRRNLGYGEAFSWAVAGCHSDVLVLLNNDIVLPEETFDHCVHALLADEGLGVVGPALRYADGSLQSGAARLSRWTLAPFSEVEPGPRVIGCDWLYGAVLFIRRTVAEQVPMDGSFFLGYEDIDLCLRVRRAGWRVACCGAVTATHHRAAVIGVRWYYYETRNRVWFLRAHRGAVLAGLVWSYAALRLVRVFAADVVKKRGRTPSRLYTLGLGHALRRKPSRQRGPLPAEPLADRVLAHATHRDLGNV